MRRFTAPALLALLVLASCTAPLCPEYSPGPIVHAGLRYELSFAAPVDTAPVGTRWSHADFARSLLEPMSRPAVIIKADDLRAQDKKYFARLTAVMARRKLPVSLGLIAKSLLDDPSAHLQCLASYPSGVVEVWNHGFDHMLTDTQNEFFGTGLEHQRAHLAEAQRLARVDLGIEMHTFGAPGNGTDADTPLALAQFPELEVNLFGQPVATALNIPHTIDIEAPIFHVVTADIFRASLNADRARWLASKLPQTLQGHPKKWDGESWSRFEAILDLLTREEKVRFTTPIAEAHWLKDAELIGLEKIGPTKYRLDLTRAAYEHVLQLSAEPIEISELR